MRCHETRRADTAADPFTRADWRWRRAQAAGSDPLPLARGEVLELRRQSSLMRTARVFAAGALYFAWLLGVCWLAWVFVP